MIHQLQVSYAMAQDRLLVRLNTQGGEELRLWLTRSMMKKLLGHLLNASGALDTAPGALESHDGSSSAALAQFKKQEALQQADFKTPFKASASALPIGAEPLLATTVHISPLAAGSLRLGFEDKSDASNAPRGFEVTLDAPLLHGFMHLLDLALKEADWGLALSPAAKALDAQALDALVSAEPPRYLN
ncbi:MAG: hypothetical protein KKD09_17725 [Gammaproteobacteria bacterium]|nr:hypothetical protein [Gammaproteobacteria bacterium]MBU4115085.1 hypothetical protein [Gammaproteobacteria bacterium]